MKNNTVKIEMHKRSEPMVGLKYQHLTEGNIEWLYRNENNINYKLKTYRGFKEKYYDLEKFEKELNVKQIKESSGNNNFTIWYIYRLIEYRRINVDLEVLMNLRITRKNIFSVNSNLIDLDFINEFEDTAIDKLMYNEEYIRKNVTFDLVRGLFYYHVKIDDFIDKSVEYYEIINDKREKGILNKNNGLTIIKILKQMDYNINYDFNYTPNIAITGELLKNVHYEFRGALEEYGEYLIKNRELKTAKTEISHLRTFFNFLYEYYSEVDTFSKLSNEHVVEFIKEQKSKINIQGKHNSNATINHRLQALKKMLNYYDSINKFNIKPNIVTEYDNLRETKVYIKYRSQEEIFEVIDAVVNTNTNNIKEEQYKLALIISIDTGRRIHEVLSLSYDCLEDGKVFFHKVKNNKPGWQIVGQATIDAIRLLRKKAENIKLPIYSREDNMSIRRLFPSFHYKATRVIARGTVDDFFVDIQLENGIIDEQGEAIYTLHDNKKNFVANMLNSGIDAESIAKFLNQDVNSLIPYEVNNTEAINTLKSVEEKGLLVGNSYYEKLKEKDNEIIQLLKDVDVINRNKQNLILKINNPKETLPLAFGHCTDYRSFEICGDLICLACDEFQTDSLEDFKKYALKMYKYIYKYKRDEIVRDIENRLLISLEKVYDNLEIDCKEDFKTIIKKIKKQAREEIKKSEERK